MTTAGESDPEEIRRALVKFLEQPKHLVVLEGRETRETITPFRLVGRLRHVTPNYWVLYWRGVLPEMGFGVIIHTRSFARYAQVVSEILEARRHFHMRKTLRKTS